MFIKVLARLCVIGLAVTSLNALAQSYSPEDLAREAGNIKIDRVLDLPIKGMKAIASNEGVIFISEDGRFAFKGKMYDIWNQDQYSSIELIQANAFRVDLRKMQIDPDSMNTFTIGTGPKEVVAFVDPNCPYCHKVIDLALAKQETHTFKIVMVATLGERSQTNVFQAACAKNKVDVIPAMLSKSMNTLDLVPQQRCNPTIVEHTNTVAKLLGIQVVPYTIAPNGTVLKGFVKNFEQIIDAN